MMPFQYHKPRTLKEAWQLRDEHAGARYIAGGTDLMVKIKNKIAQPPALISLRSIEELRGIESGEVMRIGALTPIREILEHPALQEQYPALVEACRALGGPQIRNVATIGGNLCNASPCADTAPPLLVHEAGIKLSGPQGEREVALDAFFRGPGEIDLAADEVLTSIVLPPPAPGTLAAFKKKRRVRMDLAQASVAVLLVMEGKRCTHARVAAGSVAPTPIRLKGVEALLEGAELTPALLEEARALAVKSVSPIDDIRCSASYRRQIVGVYLKREVMRLLGWREA